MESINIETIACAAQHVKAYFQQCADEKLADWGEACVGCKHRDTCNYDWLARLQPLFESANVTIQLCQQGHSDK